MPACRDVFLGRVDPRLLTGIEFGPLSNPVVRKEEGEVYYVDYTDTEGLRKAFHSTPPHLIEEVDIVWSSGTPLLPRTGKLVDYVIANHVLEHIPDFLGWMQEMHAVLRIGGLLCLTLPDKRFTFDVGRPVSTFGEVLENNVQKLTRPPLRALLDQVGFGMSVNKASLWQAGPRSHIPFDHDRSALEEAITYIARWTSSNDYIDAHVWVFTPASFLETIEALSMLGLFPFCVTFFLGTEENEYDFHVHLESTRESSDTRIAESIVSAKEMISNSPAEKLYHSRGRFSNNVLAAQ
jgi:hypothetical protein